MKTALIFLLTLPVLTFAQYDLATAKARNTEYNFKYYRDWQEFINYEGYGAPVIRTTDEGAAICGHGNNKATIVKFDKEGKEQWVKTLAVKKDGYDLETQGMIQDGKGNYFIFIASYQNGGGGPSAMRVVYLDTKGEVIWDNVMSEYARTNKPFFNYAHLTEDGTVEVRGHIMLEEPPKGENPTYYRYYGWINNKGKIAKFEIGDVLTRSNPEQKKELDPGN